MNEKSADQNKPEDKGEDHATQGSDSNEIVVSETVPEKVEAVVEPDSEQKPDVKTDGASTNETTKSTRSPESSKPARQRRGFPWFGVFNFLLILCLAAAAGYYWQLQQKTEQQKQAAFNALQREVGTKADSTQIQSGIQPLKSGLDQINNRVEQLRQEQKDLRASSEKLYELYGRDESDWKLAEVEYLMRVAQHKLILENDFEGAALTLEVASDRIAATGDPGLLQVRVKISEEVAELKTRRRADLVGMTLQVGQLSQQVRGLQPGFKPVLDNQTTDPAEPAPTPLDASLFDRMKAFFTSLWSYQREDESPPTRTEALIVNVGDKLEENLKLTRWSVLERDAFQYRRLMKENVELFEQFYSLDDAANDDFYRQLQELQKTELRPEKPDINGSLDMLKRIKSRRENAIEEENSEAAGNV